MNGPIHNRSEISLQATLSASSYGPGGYDAHTPAPHHPLTCTGQLSFFEDGSFACEHVAVGPDDERLRFAIDHSIAILLIECAHDWFWSQGRGS